MLPYFEKPNNIRLEKHLRDWYCKELRKNGFFVYIIRNVENIVEKPFDAIAVSPDWKWIAIEFKRVCVQKAKIRSSLAPHQIKYLKTFPWDAYVIVLYNPKGNKKNWHKKENDYTKQWKTKTADGTMYAIVDFKNITPDFIIKEFI